MTPTNKPRSSSPRPRPEARRSDPRPITTAAAAREQASKHLLERLNAIHIIIALAVFLAIVGGAFFLLSGDTSGLQNGGAKARMAMEDKDWNAALKSWQSLLDNYDVDKSPVIHMSMGRCFLELKKPQEALQHLNTAVENIGEARGNYELVSGIYALRGWANLELGKAQEGLNDFAQELQMNPDHPLANYRLAKFFEAQNDYANAGPHYQRIANNPEYAKDLQAFRQKVAAQVSNIPDQELADVPEKTSPGKLTLLPVPAMQARSGSQR